MDIKVVYSSKDGNDKLHEEVFKITNHLELQERLVTIYHPKTYSSGQERFDLEHFLYVIDSKIYVRFVEYGD
jgi:hypothetical protein